MKTYIVFARLPGRSRQACAFTCPRAVANVVRHFESQGWEVRVG